MPLLTADRVQTLCSTGASCRVDEDITPLFKPGDRVVAKNMHPTTHTRLPRYVRGKRGVIVRDHGVFVLPDAHAHGRGKKPQHLYSVRFAARELWGDQASPTDCLHVDMWDDYLDPA